jgi:hypothetical protein
MRPEQLNPFVRIHPEHLPNGPFFVYRLCAEHLAMARDCRMVVCENVPIVESECFCKTCHFCEN